MPDHRPPLCAAPGLPPFRDLRCMLDAGHGGPHEATATWAGPSIPTDEFPTISLPPIRESLGPRRRPPAPVVAELSERLELLRALVDELRDDEGDDQ